MLYRNPESQLAKAPSPFVVIGSAPPPHTGQSIFLPYVVRLLADGHCDIHTLKTRRSQRHWGAAVVKACHAGRLLLSLLAGPRRTSAVIILETKFGLWVNIMECLVLRLKGARLFLSHHSFACINEKRLLMRLLQIAAGETSINLFLCDCMAAKFGVAYPAAKARQWLVLNNVGRIEQDEVGPSPRGESAPLTLGFISNISFEKGVADFFDLVRAVRERGRTVRAIIAGPTADPEVQAYLDRRLAECAGCAEWIGPAYGEDKARFFERVHLLVFPTRYAVEAQPNVLLEALRFGIPCVSTDRGCITEDLEGSGSLILPQGASFVEGALPFVLEAGDALDEGRWAQLSARARECYRELRERDAASQAVFRSMFFSRGSQQVSPRPQRRTRLAISG